MKEQQAKCSPADEYVNKMWCILIMEHIFNNGAYSERILKSSYWQNQRDDMLTVMYQPQEDRYRILYHMWKVKRVDLNM